MPSSVEDRRRLAYQNATTLSQTMLDETFRGGENEIVTVAVLTKTVDATTYTLRFAAQPQFVGDDWYEGRAKFPEIKRTMGELQAPSLQFSEMEVELGNMDGFYNSYLEGGADYISWIGAQLTVSVGLRDVAASFMTVFDGFVPEEDGFDVERETIRIRARDRSNDLNRRSPLPYINDTDFPSAPDDSIGKIIPMVLGDWEAGYTYTASAGKISVSDGAGGNVEVLVDAPDGFYGGCIGYFVGGGEFVFSIGTYTPDTIAHVHIKRGDAMIQTVFTAAPQNTAGYWSAEVLHLNKVGGGFQNYVYQSGDVALVAVKVPYAPGKYSNAIEITQEILYTLGGKSSGDLETTSWNALAVKASPAQSDLTSIKARIWVGEEKDSVLAVALSLLEQVRCEAFVDADGLIKVTSLHPEDWPSPALAAARIEQIELDEENVSSTADQRTFFNQALLNYAYTPVTKKTALSTVQLKNQTSIDRTGKTIIKAIDCGWLYVEADAELQLTEFVRFYSAGFSYVTAPCAWVHLLRDLGEVVSFNYNIGSLSYDAVPMQIRDIGINPTNGGVKFKLLSFANFAYGAWSPSNAARFLSSASQTIANA